MPIPNKRYSYPPGTEAESSVPLSLSKLSQKNDSPSIFSASSRSLWDPSLHSSVHQLPSFLARFLTYRLLIQPHCQGKLVRSSRRQDMGGIVPKEKVDDALAVHVSDIFGRKRRRTGTRSRLSSQHRSSRGKRGLTECTLDHMWFLLISATLIAMRDDLLPTDTQSWLSQHVHISSPTPQSLPFRGLQDAEGPVQGLKLVLSM